MSEVLIFVSHSSSDGELVGALVEVIKRAFKPLDREIRCTTLAAHAFHAGSDVDDQIRRDVRDARVFIVVITPFSVISPYVLFETGARWASGAYLLPVLAQGVTASALIGPLAGLHGLYLSDRDHANRLIADLADYLDRQPEPMASYESAVDALVIQASIDVQSKQPQAAARSAQASAPALERSDVKLLGVLARGVSEAKNISRLMAVELDLISRRLQHLESLGMIQNIGLQQDVYELLPYGREVLNERGLTFQ